MKFKDYIKEMNLNMTNLEERGKTTKDNGHDHDYFIRRGSGDGMTSRNKGHLHKIKAMVVLPAPDGHGHELKTGG
jgi:hypothetical protein